MSVDGAVADVVEWKPCDVCVAVDRDMDPKAVQYCGRCGAWICEPHRGRYDLRFLAAAKKVSHWLLGQLKGEM